MAVTGRPTKLTKELQARIERAVASGNYIETAAQLNGVHKSTLYRWLKRGNEERERLERNPDAEPDPQEAPYVEFCDVIQRALAHSEAADVAVIGQAARAGQWQAAAWRLERKFPQRYGRRDHLDISERDGAEVDKDLPYERLSKALHILAYGEEEEAGGGE